METEQVRAFDIYVLGPFLVWAAFQGKLGPWAKRALFVSGVMTTFYNLSAYREAAEKAKGLL